MNKLLTSLLLSVTLMSGAQAQKKENYYVKHVEFPQSATIEQKVDMAARLVPTPQQYAWQQMELTAFLHFGINTFTGREWGDGKEDPALFNPSELDAEQWVRTLKEAGFKMVLLTAKHHDGFCLWPTATTKHSVASSPWKNGQGDVVKELRAACDKYDMKFGVYLSPWDRNAECYGDSPRYNDFFIRQLTELLTNYGEVHEVWFDGANGEGPNGKKQVYDWDAFYQTIQRLQPKAVMAIMGDDVRWVGNEKGVGRETEWNATVLTPGIYARSQENNKLNIPPDRRGLIHEADIKRLKEFADYRQQTFADNRVKNGRKYWSTTSGGEAVYALKSKSEINLVMLQEDITKGQRVEAFTVEALTDNGWKEVGKGTTIGYKRMLRFPAVNANKLRVRIDECRLTAYVSQVAAYYAEPLQEETTKEDWNNLPRSGWKQVAASPLTIDLGKTVTLSSFTYAPSKAEVKPTMAFRYQFFVSMDGKSWKEVPASGEFSNIMHNPLPQTVAFSQKVQARFIKLEATTPDATVAKVNMNEIGVMVIP